MAKTVTIHASAAMSWLIPAQATRRSDAFLANPAVSSFSAPDIFAWEVGNLVLSRARRGQLTLTVALDALKSLDVTISAPRSAERTLALTTLAVSTGLSLFDAAYLEQALQTGAALASRDLRLLEVASRQGVECFDLNDPA